MAAEKKPLRETPAKRSVVIMPAGKSRQFETGGRSVTVVPLMIKRRHRTKLIVPPAGEPAARLPTSMDLPLLRTLGKAFYWERLIESGEVANATELARLFKLEPGWVAEVLRMTLLAPDIVRAILEGRQPRHLNLHAVRGRQKEVPLDWDEQLRLFGFGTCVAARSGGRPSLGSSNCARIADTSG
jgi:hypothetical protein